MNRIYEELFIVKPDAPEEEVNSFVEQLRTQLTAAGDTVDKVDLWGKRRLAYRVDKYREGTYVLLQFTAGPESVSELERRLRGSDVVLKFLTVRIDEPPFGRVRSAPGSAYGREQECPQYRAAAGRGVVLSRRKSWKSF